MLTNCSRCNAELPIESQSCKLCGQARSNTAYGFATNSAVSTSTRLIQILVLLIKICLWGFAAFIEIGSLDRACHGDLTMSIIFSVVMFGLICFNKRLQKNYKGIGIALTLLVFVGLFAFSQSPSGKASYAEQSRQDARDKVTEQAQEAKRAVEDRKRQEQETKQEAQNEKAQAQQRLVSKPDTEPIATSSTEPNAQNGADTSTTASRVASIDAGQYVAPSDSIVSKYQAQFNGLHAVSTGESDDKIADMAYICQQAELKKGVEETNLSVLEAVNQACPSGISQGKHLSDMFALYTTLREEGVSREDAIIQLHGLVENIVHPQ